MHRLRRRTTRVSNPVCSPTLSRLSVRNQPRKPSFTTGVLPHIYAFHRYTYGIPFSPNWSSRQDSFKCSSDSWAIGISHLTDLIQPTRPLRPVIPINACTLRITAAAGTELAGASLQGTLKIRAIIRCSLLFPSERTLQPKGLHRSQRRRFVRLSPIAKDSRLQPPVGVWAVSQSQCWRSTSQSA